ncbi:hypothetical protein [Chryseobacterium sediminis]|uniref:Uncharacterized protein n=1 Tax=Chryseobacterium sediminis TaxID=1679494 RepID=A0A5B2TML7_9FLAO|nr:hypothetical protein [Chryseobacterium sediminis]KAA2215454.1 hypothetical protein FW780_21915 [Chryseobacterium sediminis]
MNIYKFYKPRSFDFFIGDLISNDIAINLVTKEEINISNYRREEIELISNEFVITNIQQFFISKNSIIFKLYIIYGRELNMLKAEFFGYKVYQINEEAIEYDYKELVGILNSRIDLDTNQEEYSSFKIAMNLKFESFYTLNSLIDRCLSYGVMTEDEILNFIILNIEEIK